MDWLFVEIGIIGLSQLEFCNSEVSNPRLALRAALSRLPVYPGATISQGMWLAAELGAPLDMVVHGGRASEG